MNKIPFKTGFVSDQNKKMGKEFSGIRILAGVQQKYRIASRINPL